MKTPIFDFVKGYAASGVSRFHMPGHKGVPRLGCEPLDITEVAGADVLYAPEGIIAESEQNATALFGTAHTYYSAEGSSLAIKAMLALALPHNGCRKTVLAARNAHKAFLYAAALLDFDVEWIYPPDGSRFCSCPVTAEQLEMRLAAGDLPHAVYVTSPDYPGQTADVAALAKVCDSYDIPLLVDNAHGAYLKFLPEDTHPITLGAAMCCDSAHKTLPVLTGGAYLHVAPKVAHLCEAAREKLALFASTSPSYLILQSLDLCNAYLADGYREKLAICIQKIEALKQKCAQTGLKIAQSEPLKLVLEEIDGEAACAVLRTALIEPEFVDSETVVLMITPENTAADLMRLECALPALATCKKGTDAAVLPSLPHPAMRMTVREALLAAHEVIPVEDAVGRVCSAPAVSCPPAIPIAVCGEEITPQTVSVFRHFGITEVPVVKI
ncbi:MAG: amino acid decarboxylase [Clostridia bacterium]|nr:amino acid decarboxylase [Clostridia bacterium]